MSIPEPVRCVGGLVYDGVGRLLLIKRGHEPGRGLWSLPGGRVEPEESLVAAMLREVLEETGLIVRAGPVVGVVQRPGAGGLVYEITDFAAELVGGHLQAGDDAEDARFVGAAELIGLPLSPGLYATLRDWGALPRDLAQS